MSWTKSPKSLVKFFYEVVPKDSLVESRKMFGCPCCFVNGNMFTGLHQSHMILRLSESDRKEFLKKYKTKLFQPFPNQTLREYAVVPKPLMGKRQELDRLIEKSFKYAASLPSKQ